MVSTRSKAKSKSTTSTTTRLKPALAPKPRVKPAATKRPQPASASKTLPTDLPIHAFPSVQAFESFLDQHHTTIPGIWLKLARKSSGIPSIGTWEAVEVALCFGWINGQGKSFDDQYYLARYTPRRPKSLWSELNVDLVEKLTNEGRMRSAGLKVVEEAKADGRWERAYARPRDMVVPEDLTLALEGNEPARALFEGLGKSLRYNVLHKVYTASPTTRVARVKAVVDGLAVGKIPGEKAKD